MNKYKKALIALANVVFETEDTPYGDFLIRQSLYRHLYKVGIIQYKDGEFIYKGKASGYGIGEEEEEDNEVN